MTIDAAAGKMQKNECDLANDKYCTQNLCMQKMKIFTHYTAYLGQETNFSKMQHSPTLIFVTLVLDKPHSFSVQGMPCIADIH